MNSPLSDNLDDSDNECPDEYKDIFTTKNWSFEKKFPNSEQAMKYLKSQQLWDIDQKKCFAVVGGYKAMYRCTFVGDTANQCSAAKCIFFPNTSSEVLIFRSDRRHEHDTKENNKSLESLNEKIKSRITQLIEKNMRPKQITQQLEFEGYDFNVKQLRSLIPKLRRIHTTSKVEDEWTLEKKFDSVDATKEYLKSLKIWSRKFINYSEFSSRCHYRCNQVLRHGPQCAAKMYYIQNQIPGDVLLYRNNLEHTHEFIISNSRQSEAQQNENSLDQQDILQQSMEIGVATSSKSIKQNDERENEATKFILQMSFENVADAEEYFREKTIWSKYNKVISRDGLKEYFCCNLEDEEGASCPAELYLLHSVKSGKIQLYRNTENHNHQKIIPNDNLIEDDLMSEDNDEIILDYNDCEDIIMDEVPTNELIGEEIIIGDFVDEDQFAIEVNGDEWMFKKKFENHSQAVKYLENRYMLLLNRHEVPLGGYQEYYRCGLTLQPDDPPCPAMSYIEYFDELSDVLLYKNMLTRHAHDEVLPISCIQTEKKKACIVKGINIKTIEKWLRFITFVPSHDEDKPFCPNYAIDHKNQTFQCFITTKRLLKIALESRIVNADFKFTLGWQTHHIFIIGTTDMDQIFHSFGIVIAPTKTERDYEFAFSSLNIGISLCYACEFRPEMLISNSKSIIQNAFVTVYGTDQSKLITCANYMLAEITSSLKIIVPNETVRNEIICDIEKIQSVPSPEIFLEAIILFVKKWNETQAKFVEYFKTKWIQKNTNWYIGVSHYTPATNEALASECKRIASEYNFKHNQNFTFLKTFVDHVVDTWSNAYVSQSKIFARKPTISLTLYDEACEWNEIQTQIDIEEIDTDTTYYYVPCDKRIIEQEKLAKYKSKFHENLAEFFDVQFSFWEMKQIRDADITCSCPYFFRHYICKHSLGMATALNLYTFPTEKITHDLSFKKEEDEESEGEVILS